MPKPTELPAWATDTDANVVAPTTSLKQNGWLGNAVPTAQNFNWLFKRIGQWLTWLGDRFTDDGGVKRIRIATTTGSLNSPTPTDGDVVFLLASDMSPYRTPGLFIYSANSMADVDVVNVFVGPNGTGGAGRWLAVWSQVRGDENGLAPLDGFSRLPRGNLPTPLYAVSAVASPSTGLTAITDLTGLAVTLNGAVAGRPIVIVCMPSGSSMSDQCGFHLVDDESTTGIAAGCIQIALSDNTDLGTSEVRMKVPVSGTQAIGTRIPPASVQAVLVPPSAGNYTFKLRGNIKDGSANARIDAFAMKLMAYQL